jgi:Rne/Rng family ribonuclease
VDILIEESEGCLWAAALMNGKLQGLEIDPLQEEVRWGSIYRATVKTIDPARDAAFLDLDGSNTGILYNKDIRVKDEDGKTIKGGDIAIGKILSPGSQIIVQAKTAYIATSDDQYTGNESKIPQLSMDIALQGRHLIYCPMMEKNRLSQRITDTKLRTQIKAMMEAMEEQDVQGFILRAAAANTQTDILRRESEILEAVWNQIETMPEESGAHILIEGPDAIQRILSDNAAQHIQTIEIVTMDHFTHIENWCSIFAPDLMTKITPVELIDGSDDLALFHERDIMGQIESLFHSYAHLPSGGNLIIQTTAALTAIDVNKSSDRNAHISTNLEAATEAIRQIRLRNSGGIIMIDFINAKSKSEQTEILNRLYQEAAKDPCTVQIHGFTGAGLVEISRKRRTPPLDQRINLDEI